MIKHYPLEVENQELFVSVGVLNEADLLGEILELLSKYKEIVTYVDENVIKAALKNINRHNACYVYLGMHGRGLHLIYFKQDPYLYQIGHELQHMAFQIMRNLDLKINDHSGEEYFCMLTSYWFRKLQSDIRVAELPQN